MKYLVFIVLTLASLLGAYFFRDGIGLDRNTFATTNPKTVRGDRISMFCFVFVVLEAISAIVWAAIFQK